MARYVCSICGYVHDDAAGELFGDLPDSWTCPVCGAAKSEFDVEAASDAPVGATETTETTETAETRETGETGETAVRPPRRGAADKALWAHRVFGYVFLAVYVVMMVQMVPRLWTYQIEFPARTVVHLALGMAVGVILLLKIGIVRFFRRLDQALVPLLGTSLLVSSVVLIGISVPSAFREAFVTAKLFTPVSQQRVKTLLTQAGLDAVASADYSTARSLRQGQRILRHECIGCHDLRTVLAKPRTPSLWRQTVRRMADRTTLLDPLSETQQWQVTAYLTALSPQLQKSSRQLSQQREQRASSLKAAEALTKSDGSGSDSNPSSYDAEKAAALVAAKCSQCHDASLVAGSPPASAEEARQLVSTMVEEGLEVTDSELALIIEYLEKTYIK